MAQPIYKLFQAKFTEAWHQLPGEEQRRLETQVEEALAQVGAKRVLLCVSAWANEQWTAFGVEEFPDIEAVQKHSQLLIELNWFRYLESITTLGTPYTPEP